MGKNTDNLMHEMLKYLSQIDYVHPEDIPDIDLYMDPNAGIYLLFQKYLEHY